MSVSMLHVFEQTPVIWAFGRTAASVLASPSQPKSPPACPGPWLEATLAPRSAGLVRDYIRHVGGDPSWYRGLLPPHLFPQWTFPTAARTLIGVPYPLANVMNAGCRLEINGPLAADEPLVVSGRLDSIDDDGRRAILRQKIRTGTAAAPETLQIELRAFVPLGRKPGGKTAKKKGGNGAGPAAAKREPKARPTVPAAVREIAYVRLGAHAGLDFAKLTGDFNPVHWLSPYARAAGFPNCILHGFGTMARAIEALNRSVFAGDPQALRAIDVRFTAPLILPASVGVYIDDAGGIYVGAAPSGPSYLEGRFETRSSQAQGVS